MCGILKDSEESRISFIKKIFERFVKSKTSLVGSMQVSLNRLLESLNDISAKDTSMLEIECLDKFTSFPQEKWTTYDEWKSDLKRIGQDPVALEDGYISPGLGYTPMHKTLALIKGVIYSLFPKKDRKMSIGSSSSDSVTSSTDTEDKMTSNLIVSITDLLLTDEGQRIFIETLETKKQSSVMEPQHLQSLANFITIILSSLMNENICEYILFYKIVVLSHIFHCCNAKKAYLFQCVSHHPIFQEKRFWSQTIDMAINSKVIADNEAFHRSKKRIRHNKIQPKNFKKSKFSAEKSEKNTATLLLNHFNFYMANLRTQVDIAKQVITELSNKSKIDDERRFSLMTELYAVQIDYYQSENKKPKSLKQR